MQTIQDNIKLKLPFNIRYFDAKRVTAEEIQFHLTSNFDFICGVFTAILILTFF